MQELFGNLWNLQDADWAAAFFWAVGGGPAGTWAGTVCGRSGGAVVPACGAAPTAVCFVPSAVSSMIAAARRAAVCWR